MGVLSDGQMNDIKIIPFVCLSQVRVAGRISSVGVLSDGQSKGVKNIQYAGLTEGCVGDLQLTDKNKAFT